MFSKNPIVNLEDERVGIDLFPENFSFKSLYGGMPKNYEVGEVIGHGGMAIIRAATYKGQDIAIKSLRPVIFNHAISQDCANVQSDFDEFSNVLSLKSSFINYDKNSTLTNAQFLDAIKYFENEAKLINDCNHKNIISNVINGERLQAFEQGGQLHIPMQRCVGSLDEILNKPNTSEEFMRQLYTIMHCAVEGISYLHREKNIVHMDIKDSQFLYTKEGNVVLSDFGFARNIGQKINGKIPTEALAEFDMTERLTQAEKAIDVYAFGKMLSTSLLQLNKSKREVVNFYRISDTADIVDLLNHWDVDEVLLQGIIHPALDSIFGEDVDMTDEEYEIANRETSIDCLKEDAVESEVSQGVYEIDDLRNSIKEFGKKYNINIPGKLIL